jgi:hypothetical protein
LPLRWTAPLAAVAALALTTPIAIAEAPPAHATQHCFLSADWQNWTAPNPGVIYIRVNSRDIYRLDLSGGFPEIQEPGVHLVNRMAGSEWVCSPLDLQLSIAEDHGGMREAIIVQAITKLTPDEVQAIPPKFRP